PANASLADLVLEGRALQILRRMFLGLRLHAQTRGHFFALGALLGLADHFVQGVPFLFSIEVSKAAWIEVGNQLFADPAILLASHVAGGKMHKPRVVGA